MGHLPVLYTEDWISFRNAMSLPEKILGVWILEFPVIWGVFLCISGLL